MTRKEYLKQLDKICKTYKAMRKRFAQSDGRMHLAITQEETERKLQLTNHFYNQK